jgi:hypothetical protein
MAQSALDMDCCFFVAIPATSQAKRRNPLRFGVEKQIPQG